MHSEVIPKGEAAKDALWAEIDRCFAIQEHSREGVERCVEVATSPDKKSMTYEELYCEAKLVKHPLRPQPVECVDCFDCDGRPAGGWAEGKGLQIRWSHDADDEWDGSLCETVLQATYNRLKALQDKGLDFEPRIFGGLSAAIVGLQDDRRKRFKRNGDAYGV